MYLHTIQYITTHHCSRHSRLRLTPHSARLGTQPLLHSHHLSHQPLKLRALTAHYCRQPPTASPDGAFSRVSAAPGRVANFDYHRDQDPAVGMRTDGKAEVQHYVPQVLLRLHVNDVSTKRGSEQVTYT